MTGDTEKRSGRGKNPAPDEAALSKRLETLSDRLASVGSREAAQEKDAAQEGEQASARASAMARGFQLSTEFVAGVLVGTALGWGLDWVLATKPFGMIAGLLIGFAAGVINVMRAAGRMSGGVPDSTRGKF